MKQATQKEVKNTGLDNAKERLRNALSQLEQTVDERLEHAKKASGDSATVKEFTELKDRLQNAEEENTHLREENQRLNAQTGKEKDEQDSLRETNNHAVERVNGLIVELEAMLQEAES